MNECIRAALPIHEVLRRASAADVHSPGEGLVHGIHVLLRHIACLEANEQRTKGSVLQCLARHACALHAYRALNDCA